MTGFVCALVVLTGMAWGGTVRVCMEGSTEGPTIMTLAETKAALMFAKIGVEIDWRHGGKYCKTPPEDAIVVSLARDTLPSNHPGALALAKPYEGSHIEVFFDRVERTVEPRAVPALLAHVLVHEIAHILEGVSRHSDSGLMKATFTAADYSQMMWKSMPFAAIDVLLIERGMAARSSRLAKR